ncbi:site-2 protease family protein [Pseudochryseolinea flava]|uniref:Site-2 protease family protein n=1 Tax=Pseudochryseolinea flava TaxID=2059302 RepID=A0A364XUV8_9BACT|nr:site-2 protease family protein [Pseudochryseolinea flava]RAV98057.1 site-2 protease family protein [Pseudochryseolinea flava]
MKKETKTILVQIFLFLFTFVSTTLAGAEWAYSKSIYSYTKEAGLGINTNFSWADFCLGMNFSIPFLLILTVHEFGHYFTALAYKVKSSLPYYLPVPPIPGLPSFGTLGAVIRIRERVRTNVQNFDIGLAGPLAGFIVALIVITYGFLTLPPPEYIFQFHPEYKQYGLDYASHVYTPEYIEGKQIFDIKFGDNLLFYFFKHVVADPARVPNPHELMHYPVLMAGLLSLLFTSINLFPIGQLDGGHITYGLFGEKKHRLIATVTFVSLIFFAGLGSVKPTDSFDELQWSVPLTLLFYYFCFGALKTTTENTVMITLLVFAIQLVIGWLAPQITGYSGGMLFLFLIARVIGLYHPPSEIEQPLNRTRVILGWISLIIFVISFTPYPIS